MSHSSRNHPNARRMLQRMPKEISQSFTLEQTQAIEDALVPRTHKIDLRCLIPLLGQGAYFVLAAGPNRRDTPRVQPLENDEASDAISQMCRTTPNTYYLLSRMPAALKTTFSWPQIKAIESALVPRRHLIDLRLSLPFLGKGAYLVLAAGPNKRSHYRNLQNRNPLVVPAVITSGIAGAAALLGLVYLKGSTLLAKPDPVFAKDEAFHPTAVPFKKNRGECEESGRQWIDDQCIDKTHDPVF
ncbi:MAG: hypothetical protein AAF635_07895 [Cyanobacteria bacterium P01_C01_bin.69]